jgi:hypothetical protein
LNGQLRNDENCFCLYPTEAICSINLLAQSFSWKKENQDKGKKEKEGRKDR